MPRKKKDSPPSAFAARVFEAERAGSVGSPIPLVAEPALSTSNDSSPAGQPTEDTPGIVPALERAARKGVESEGSVGCRTGHETEPDPEPSVTQSPQAEPDGSGFGPFTLEEAFTAEWGAQIRDATPCQRANCRILDGLAIDDLIELDPHALDMFGGVRPPAIGIPPAVAMLLSGIRTAKSTTIALAAAQKTQTIQLPDWIRASDLVRIPIVSTSEDTAGPTFTHVRDTIMNSPRLSRLLACDEKGKPLQPKTDSILLRHPSGKNIEIKVVALSRAGSTMTARWFASAIFDEAPRMGGEVDYVRSFDEAFRACRGRVLPGGTIMLAGSPHARIGPVYDLFRKHFGKPTQRFVVSKAKGPWLNPTYWTPEKCAEIKADDPTAHQTDVEGDFKDPESALGDSESIEKAMRPMAGHVSYVEGHHYVAAMDPATRVNTWTLVILECHGHEGVVPKYRIAWSDQWTPEPGKTLSPSFVFTEARAAMKLYGLSECYSDIAGTDFAIELARQHGIDLLIDGNPDKLELGRQMMALIKRGLLELPLDERMREDLQSVRTRTSTAGNVQIHMPKSAGGRHCDYFPSLCLAVKNLPEPPDEKEETTMQQRDLEREIADFASRNDDTDGARASRKASGW